MARKKAAGHDERSPEYQRGMTQIRKQLGPMADAYIRNIKALAPEFAWVNVTFPFGELYPRKTIDLKTRELCTVAALTVQASRCRSSSFTSRRRCGPERRAAKWPKSSPR